MGAGSYLRGVAWGTWSLDALVLLPHGVPAIGLYVGSWAENVLPACVGPAHAAAAKAGFGNALASRFDRPAADGSAESPITKPDSQRALQSATFSCHARLLVLDTYLAETLTLTYTMSTTTRLAISISFSRV